MVYVRGHAYDYDRWEREGATGWSYANCLPYFKKSQTHELGENEYRGGSGPQHVSRYGYERQCGEKNTQKIQTRKVYQFTGKL